MRLSALRLRAIFWFVSWCRDTCLVIDISINRSQVPFRLRPERVASADVARIKVLTFRSALRISTATTRQSALPKRFATNSATNYIPTTPFKLLAESHICCGPGVGLPHLQCPWFHG